MMVGILNVTPDSFSDGGRYDCTQAALDQALKMQAEGAAIIDIGAESTRPGAATVDAQAEWTRLQPVLKALSDDAHFQLPISIDTAKPEVAERALAAGATILNDINGLLGDKRMAEVAAAAQVKAVIAMHNGRLHPIVGDSIESVCAVLEHSLEVAQNAGLNRSQIILDPGFGFGKTQQQNLQLLGRLGEVKRLGAPLLLGTSRKSFIGQALGLDVNERLEGTLATTVLGVMAGASFFRVHDVAANSRAAKMAYAIYSTETGD